MTGIRQLNPRAALLAVAIAVILMAAVFTGQSSPIPALAQSDSVAPANVAVRKGANTGEAVVSWTPNAAADRSRVGWGNISEVQAARDAGNWLEAFNFVEIRGAKSSYTVKRLEPGTQHAFIVATITANRAYTYSAWVFHTTAAAPALPSCVTPGSGGQQPSPVPNVGDYDADDDGLIDVASLAQLDAMRNDLDGNGRGLGSDYATAFPDARPGMGCPDPGCNGYELTADLDFDTNGDGRVDGRDAYWARGLGWLPIGGTEEVARWNAVFDGGGHTIANLFVAPEEDIQEVGLFGVIGARGVVSNVSLTSVSVNGAHTVGGLAGTSYGAVSSVSVAGRVSSNGIAGGVIGRMVGDARLTGSHATANVSGNGSVGGLVGEGSSSGSGAGVPRIESSYATGTVAGGAPAGGLVGSFPGTVMASYAMGAVSGVADAGGLVGYLSGSVVAGYATGPVDGYAVGGGLVAVCSHCRIADSYATGMIATRSTQRRGGLVADGRGNWTATDSFWDTKSSGMTSSVVGIGKTTREMQDTGIYSRWDPDWWDFGTRDQYPALKYRGMDVAAQR